MNNSFLANPSVLANEGRKIIDSSINFRDNADKIMENVDYMIERAYMSDGSRALANHIKSFKDDLYTMAKIMNEYGNYCVNFGKTVSVNQQNMIDMYNVND